MTATRVDPQELSPEERANLERRQAEWQARRERMEQFTATRFVRALAPPPQPGAEVGVLAILLYEDGFYVDHTYDTHPPELLDDDTGAAQYLAHLRESEPEIAIEDDVGTEYFPSGGGGGGGLRVSHSSRGFAPAPPPDARVLRVTAGEATVEIGLGP